MDLAQVSVREINASEAERLLSGRGSWRQYPSYAEHAAKRVGASARFLIVSRGAEPVAVACLRFRSLPLRLGETGLVSHGPTLLRAPDMWAEDLPFALEALRLHGDRAGCEIRIDPDPMWFVHGIADCVRGLTESEPDGKHYRTILIDIGRSLDAIRAGFHAKWRRSLIQAERRGLTVEHSSSPSDIEQVQPLLEQLMAKKSFDIEQDARFFAQVAREARGSEKICVHLVKLGNTLVSAHIGAFTGDMAVYLLGATSDLGRDLGASYLAQWEAIVTARSNGLTTYDLGGVDPVGNPEVYRFKKRMGGTEMATSRTGLLRTRSRRAMLGRQARKLLMKIRS